MTHRLTLRSLLTERIGDYGERPAIVCGGVTTTYRELAALTARVANAFRERGIGAGDRVAILLPNGVEYVAADLAILSLGAVKVPLNEMLAPRDVDHCLTDSAAVLAIAGPTLLPAVLASRTPHLREVIAVGCDTEQATSWEALLRGHDTVSPAAEPGPTDLGLVIYTGGTTGLPKGVMHTQERLALNLVSHLVELELTDDERMLLISPLPHSAGFHLQAGLVKGATIYLDAGFDPDQVLRRISEDRVTFTFMVPTMIYRLLDRIRTYADELDLSALRTILYGAAPITEERLTEGLRVLGPVFAQLYGQSEAPNFITRLAKADHVVGTATRERLTSCGRAVAMARVVIADPDQREVVELPRGSVGEIVASTPYTMTGYLGLEQATADTLVDGWLRTGDLGRMDDDGFVHLLDRKKDMIISGGMNVYSTEVESVIATVHGVKDVAVVGLPHPDWGEAVVACVVADGSADPDTIGDLVLQTCRTELSRYKVPKRIEITDQLPLTPVGKLDKKQLRSNLTSAPEAQP